MGDMADYFIERQLNRHLNPEKEFFKLKRQRQIQMENMADQELMDAAQNAFKRNLYNEKFADLAKKILSQKPTRLTQKQRNCFYGLLTINLR